MQQRIGLIATIRKKALENGGNPFPTGTKQGIVKPFAYR